jgi:hypothetical protein
MTSELEASQPIGIDNYRGIPPPSIQTRPMSPPQNSALEQLRQSSTPIDSHPVPATYVEFEAE